MTIPEKVKILGFEWTIKTDKHVANEGQCYGSTHHSSQTIFLEPDLSQQHREQVFLHEMLHAIFWQMGLGKEDKIPPGLEEKIVSALSSGLYVVLKDNDLLK